MKSWEVTEEAWDAFSAEEDMCVGVQAVYDVGVRAGIRIAAAGGNQDVNDHD